MIVVYINKFRSPTATEHKAPDINLDFHGSLFIA